MITNAENNRKEYVIVSDFLYTKILWHITVQNAEHKQC